MNAKYEYLAGYGEIGKKSVKGQKERMSFQLCKESWNGYVTYAIRAFSDSGNPMKGVTLTEDMLRNLKKLLNEMEI